jgi:hypothetical protein
MTGSERISNDFTGLRSGRPEDDSRGDGLLALW